MRYGQGAGIVGLVFSIGMVGCARITTQVVEKPRVDQETQQGNRGYLQGSGPASAPRSSTRQMLQTDIELPTVEELNPWRKPARAAQPAPAAPEKPVSSESWQQPEETSQPEMEPAPLGPVAPKAVSGTPYTVQKGDTLEKISKKFYGTSRKWRRIYDANRNVLRTPDRLYTGQKLVIPPDSQAPASGSEGGQDFK